MIVVEDAYWAADGVPLLVEELVYAREESGVTGAKAGAGSVTFHTVSAVVSETVARRMSRMGGQHRPR